MNLQDTAQLMLSDDYKERLVAEYHQADIRLQRLLKCLVKNNHSKDVHEHLLNFLPKLVAYRNAVKASCEFSKIDL